METRNSTNSTNKQATIAMDNFASTTQLTDLKNGMSEKQENYDPFALREVQHPNSDLGVLVHLLKGSLGTGILAMPLAFKNAGLAFGFFATIIVGIICTHCVHILVKCSHILCHRAQTPMLGYADTAEAAFKHGSKSIQPYSNWARNFVNGSLVATYYSANCVYVVFIAESFTQVVDYHHPGVLDIRMWMAIILIPLIGMGLIRNLKHLVPFSAMANLFIVISFAITLYYMFQELPPIGDRPLIAPILQMPLFFSTAIFAMEGIGVVMPLENSMKTPQHFIGCPGVLNIAMSIVVVLYTVIGFFGYLRYGDDVKGSITLNLPTEQVLAQVVQILMAVAILFTYGLQFYVPTEIVWGFLKTKVNPSKRNLVQNSYRVIVVTLTVCVAVAIPNLGPLISLVGAICFSNLGLMCPAIIDIVVCYDSASGKGIWNLIKNILIIIFALFALVSGTYASINEMIVGGQPDE